MIRFTSFTKDKTINIQKIKDLINKRYDFKILICGDNKSGI